jgi:hypothetical protein
MHSGGRHGGEAHQHAAWRLPRVALAGLTLMMPGELATACSGSPGSAAAARSHSRQSAETGLQPVHAGAWGTRLPDPKPGGVTRATRSRRSAAASHPRSRRRKSIAEPQAAAAGLPTPRPSAASTSSS